MENIKKEMGTREKVSMKKVIIRLTASLMAFFIMLMFMPSSLLQIQAAAPKVNKRIDVILYPNNNSYSIVIQNSTKKGKITDIKVEKEEIVQVSLSHDKKYLWFSPKKNGDTKLSFKYAGKTLSTTIYVEEWKNPCKKFVLGTNNLKKKFDKSGQFNQAASSKKDVKKKIKVEAANGWKIIGIYRLDINSRKKVKNNSKVCLTNSGTGTGVGVIFLNQKTKKKELLYYGYGGKTSYNVYNDRERIQQLMNVFMGK